MIKYNSIIKYANGSEITKQVNHLIFIKQNKWGLQIYFICINKILILTICFTIVHVHLFLLLLPPHTSAVISKRGSGRGLINIYAGSWQNINISIKIKTVTKRAVKERLPLASLGSVDLLRAADKHCSCTAPGCNQGFLPRLCDLLQKSSMFFQNLDFQ